MHELVQRLPERPLRYLPGLRTPEEIILAIDEGVDLLDASYALKCAQEGYALTFPFITPNDKGLHGMDDGLTYGSDPSKINLRAVAYK